MLVGLAMSAGPIEERSTGVLFNYEDSISGNGNFASYNKLVVQGPHSDARVISRLANVYLQKANHGSGSIEKESIIKSTESRQTQIDPDMIYSYGLIAALDNNSMVYSPQTIAIGSGYYSIHPVSFSSLLGDLAQIKNYASKTSMGQEIDYAHAINIDRVASVEDDYFDKGDAKSLSKTFMNLNEDVTSGTARIEMLQGGTRKSKTAWSDPDIDVDQVYTGTFNYATKMNLTVPVNKIVSEDYWLPCCSGGWMNMTYSDKKSFGTDAKGFFDCNCPKEPTKAQSQQEG
jgi:hypothetical protein